MPQEHFFLILGVLNSKTLSPFNNLWIKFGELLGRIIAPIVMALVYFIILTPISFLVRVFGKDLLGLKFLKNQSQSLLVKPMKYGVISGGKKIRSTIIFDVGKLFKISEKKRLQTQKSME